MGVLLRRADNQCTENHVTRWTTTSPAGIVPGGARCHDKGCRAVRNTGSSKSADATSDGEPPLTARTGAMTAAHLRRLKADIDCLSGRGSGGGPRPPPNVCPLCEVCRRFAPVSYTH